MLDVIENIIPESKKRQENEDICTYKRRLSSYAVSMEIVPFKSMKERGVSKALSLCWENYTKRALDLTRPQLIFLVGAKAKEHFLKVAFNGDKKESDSARKAFRGKSRYEYNESKVFALPHFSICGGVKAILHENNLNKDGYNVIKEICDSILPS